MSYNTSVIHPNVYHWEQQMCDFDGRISDMCMHCTIKKPARTPCSMLLRCITVDTRSLCNVHQCKKKTQSKTFGQKNRDGKQVNT